MDLLSLENEKDISEGSIPLMKKYVDNGNIVTKLPTIQEIREIHLQQQLLLPRNLSEVCSEEVALVEIGNKNTKETTICNPGK
jgi:hypothetical protein